MKKRLLSLQFLFGLMLLTQFAFITDLSAQNLPGSGNKLSFNGFSTYINCGTNNRGITQRVTVEAWIRTTSIGYQWIAGKYSNSLVEEKGFHLYTNNGAAYFNGRTSVGVYMSSGPSRTRVDDGRWHHIAGVCNLNSWQVYVDGVLENSATYSFTRADLTTTSALAIGEYIVQSENLFLGDIDEVRIWRTAQTQEQIRANMCRKIAPVPADLVAYYNFDQTSGLVAIDKGSVPVNGTLSNFTSNNPWQLSGAAIGDASTYAYGADLRTTRLRLAATNGDSAIVNNITTQTDGVQLYTVNQEPSVKPSAGNNAAVYFGVFSRGGTGAYDFRLRPNGGLSCSSLYTRPANDGTWATVTAASTATSLLAPQQRYRAEYIQAGANLSAFPVRISGDTVLCLGGSVQLTADVSGSATAFRWNTGTMARTITVTQPGIYSMTATFLSGCTITRSRQVIPADLRIIGDSVLCGGGSLTLRAVSTLAGIAFRWNNGATTADITVTQPGTYLVTSTFSGGCTVTRQLIVRPSTAVVAFALGPDTTVCEGTPLLLRAPVGNAYTYLWSDGSTGSTLLARQGGTYSVTVRSGCNVQTASRTLTANLCVPNIITPNKDGRNDAFVVSSYNVGEWSVAIYNRWGKEVYQTERYLNDWGPNAAPGVYYYMLRRGATNSTLKGWLEVVR